MLLRVSSRPKKKTPATLYFHCRNLCTCPAEFSVFLLPFIVYLSCRFFCTLRCRYQLALAQTIFIYQDLDDKKKYGAHFRNFSSGYDCRLDLNKDDVERLEYILIESGKFEIESMVQFNPYIREESI
jgi:hypothetical protein